MSLRNRVADLIDQAPLGRRLWFAAPMKLSLAAVAAVAVVAIAVLVFRPPTVGPTPSQTAEPSASGSATATAEPSATVEPTPVPTPGVAAWTGVEWSADVVGTSDGANIYDILPWNGQYIGAGSVSPVIGEWPIRGSHESPHRGLLHLPGWHALDEDVSGQRRCGGRRRRRSIPPRVGRDRVCLRSAAEPALAGGRCSGGRTTASPGRSLDSPTWRDALAPREPHSSRWPPAQLAWWPSGPRGSDVLRESAGPASDHPFLRWPDLGSA